MPGIKRKSDSAEKDVPHHEVIEIDLDDMEDLPVTDNCDQVRSVGHFVFLFYFLGSGWYWIRILPAPVHHRYLPSIVI